MSCAICFEDFMKDDKKIQCIDDQCNTCLCVDCFNQYVLMSYESKTLVSCINCRSDYNYNIIKKYLNESSNIVYEEMIVNTIEREFQESINFDENVRLAIERIRNGKKVFIKNTFPPAIDRAIGILYKKELEQVSKKNELHIKQKMESERNNKPCLSHFCIGRTNSDFVCSLCSIKWCFKCEKREDKNHKCLECDLESMKILKKYGKCPNCGVLVEKIDGCRYVTCAVCQTHFDYYNGKKTKGGNHGQNTFTMNIKLSEIKGQTPDVIKLLEKIERMRPTTKSVCERLKASYLAGVSSTTYRLFDMYNAQKLKSKKYMEFVDKLWRYNGEFEVENLEKIIQVLK